MSIFVSSSHTLEGEQAWAEPADVREQYITRRLCLRASICKGCYYALAFENEVFLRTFNEFFSEKLMDYG